MVLCYIVPLVGGSCSPVNPELFLAFSATQPMESHVHGFGAAWLDGVVYNSEGRGVVGLDQCLGLHVAHFFELMAGGDGFAAVDVKCAEFCFCG